MATQEKKKVTQSRTMRFNVIVLPILMAIPQILQELLTPDAMEAVKVILPDRWESFVVAIAIVGNVILRKLTTHPL